MSTNEKDIYLSNKNYIYIYTIGVQVDRTQLVKGFAVAHNVCMGGIRLGFLSKRYRNSLGKPDLVLLG